MVVIVIRAVIHVMVAVLTPLVLGVRRAGGGQEDNPVFFAIRDVRVFVNVTPMVVFPMMVAV